MGQRLTADGGYHGVLALPGSLSEKNKNIGDGVSRELMRGRCLDNTQAMQRPKPSLKDTHAEQ